MIRPVRSRRWWRPRSVIGVALIGLGMGTLADAAGRGRVVVPVSGLESATRLDAPRTFTAIAGGDIMTGYRVRAPAAEAGALTGARFDFAPQLAEVRGVLEATDLAICHIEIPIGSPGGAYGDIGVSPFGGNLLLAPYELAAGLGSAGFDRCSTASNHANDAGSAGIDSTIVALGAHGIGTAGTARTAATAVDEVFVVNGVRVAHLSFTTYSNTNRPAQVWRLNHTTNPWTIAAAATAARDAGAEVVLVSLHVSKELTTGPIPEDRAFVTTLTAAADVDAVIIHGPHVVHPLEWVNRTPVWWSVGNFFTQMGPGSSGKYDDGRVTDGLLARVEFVETSTGGFVAHADTIAICNDFVDRTVRPATAALAGTTIPSRVRAELTGCLERVRAIVPDAR